MNRNTLFSIALVVGLGGITTWQTLRSQELQAQLAALKQQLQDSQSQLALAKANTVMPAAGNPQSQVAKPGTQTASRSAAQQTDELMDSPDYQQLMAQQMFTTRFSGFLVELKLPPGKEKELKTRLVAAIANSLALSRQRRKQILTGELPGEAAVAQARTSYESLADVLTESLTSEQRAAYQAYEAARPARERAQIITVNSAQLIATAPGLTEASRLAVATAYTDAIRNPPRARDGSTDTQMLYYQVENSLQESGTLSDDQMRIASEYLRGRAAYAKAIKGK